MHDNKQTLVDCPIVRDILPLNNVFNKTNIIEYTLLPPSYADNNDKFFAIKVKDESLLFDNILIGDFLIISLENYSFKKHKYFLASINENLSVVSTKYYKYNDINIISPYLNLKSYVDYEYVGAIVGTFRVFK